ncbi:pentatricopeptide repeat-containing protein at2g20710 mitochondrial [Phtheirospermum japonicum]|uniref:Pentatricopeptide repeat-containing protein at2g20710 mitochondrial n=1 Tax=Phtheirospermum japonicum TaxID=374723 RepID=A0A830B0G6_9LAMI|nr:pentatricopeptide repeat-containing protein at2g20710 mitochondrial [Phtheirospermum japonicum]
MSDMKYSSTKPGHIGIHLDLISKVHGLKQAEDYFNSLDNSLLVSPVYGALLNCYANAKALEKAEAVMDKIRNLNSCCNLYYNTMLSLYSRTGNHDRLESLIQEMENKGIAFDEFTYNIRLNAYATPSDIEKMEMVLMKMEADPQVTVSSFTYITSAKGYLRAGLPEKASSALKKGEHLIRNHERQTAYGVLITVYAAMREKENVYRVWDLLLKKDGGKTYFRNYACMITSLEKLDDLEGVGEIFSEWEVKNNNKNNNAYFDIRVPNLVIWAYCKKGRVREAEAILGRVLANGKEATASTWSHMAHGYCGKGEMEKAVEMTKKAFRVSFPEWKPDVATVAACLEFLKKEGDGDGIREILMLLEKCGKFSVGFKESVERKICVNEKV